MTLDMRPTVIPCIKCGDRRLKTFRHYAWLEYLRDNPDVARRIGTLKPTPTGHYTVTVCENCAHAVVRAISRRK